MTPSAATLTASGIARLADVGRAAVSNWRRRYADFPTPVGGTAASPFFDAREVEDWLRRHGRLHQASTAQWAWRHIESYQPATQLSEALGIAGAYLLVRAANQADRADQTDQAVQVDQADQVEPAGTGVRGGDDLPTPKQLLARLRALDPSLAELIGAVLPKQWTSQLTTLLRTVGQLGAEQGAEAAFEYLHSQYVTTAHSISGLAGTPDTVAEVMLTLAGSGAGTFDFTTGTGSILRMAADRAVRSGAATRCYGQEINPKYAVIALLRLWFVHLRARRAGQDVDPPVVHVGDSLLADALPDLRADVVVADFPFGVHAWGHDRLAYDSRWTYGLPPRTEPELAWVQHALAHLSPGGTAVVLMPPAAASRPAGRRVRAELIRRGALRAVVALPSGLMPPTNIGLHIWVLTQPDPRRPPTADLLVVDTTAAPAGQPLTEIVRTAWDAYLSGHHAELPGVHRTVPVIEVLDDQVDLTPQRYLPQVGDLTTDPAQIITRISEFDRLLDHIRQSLPAVRQVPAAPLRDAPQADIADLIRSGSISVHRTPSRARSTDPAVTATVLTAADVLSGGPASGSATRAANDEPGPRVCAGDILIPVVGSEITARVAAAEQVGAELGPGVQLVRVDTSRFDPWFLAGVISRTDNLRVAGRAVSSASGALRIDIKRLAIPVLPLDQQQTYGQVFRRLVEFRVALDRAAATGATLAREIGDALTTGALGLPS